MATNMKPASDDEMNYPKNEKVAGVEPDIQLDDHSLGEGVDVLALQDVDPALNAKMHIVNNVRGILHAALTQCTFLSRANAYEKGNR